MDVLRRACVGVWRYPMIAVSLLIILSLIGISIYAMLSMPLSEAVALWNDGGPYGAWKETPRAVPPAWTNLFRRVKLPETIIVCLDDFESTTEALSETMWRMTTVLTFDYNYSGFPSEIKFYRDITVGTEIPILTLTWIKPDGSELEIFRNTVRGGPSLLRISPSEAFGESRQAGSDIKLESPSEDREPRALKGTYTLRAEAIIFEEEGFSIDGRLIIYGGVYGIAGTDPDRRDLAVGLLWGAPIALMIGLIAATGTTVFGFVVAAIGAWYGGGVDAAIQRVTEVGMMIPFLPTILLVGRFYSSNIWVLLGVIVGFGLFGGPLKSYRAMFLQAKQSRYIEAARAYGASNLRIVFRYLIPRMIPTVLPRLVVGIPLFIYLEASLALLGLSDPNLPTWGKILSEARTALYLGHYHWILEPVFLLLLTGLSFSMLGYTLDRIFNPRLRST